jgi:hypothetical protein
MNRKSRAMILPLGLLWYFARGAIAEEFAAEFGGSLVG